MAINGYLAIDDNGRAVQVLKPTTTQKLTTGQVTTAFTSDSVVRIIAEGDIHYFISADPTATISHVYLPAGVKEEIKVNAGDKISVLGATAYITLLQ